MGSAGSKLGDADSLSNIVDKENGLQHSDNVVMDPRSPSSLIPRTPISSNGKIEELQKDNLPSTFTNIHGSELEVFSDPRSPSNLIPRTPISSKPENKNSNSAECHQKQELQCSSNLLDPRSPSFEFTRTPLSSEDDKPRNLVQHTVLDPRSPSVDINRTPLVLSTTKKTCGDIDPVKENMPACDVKCTPKRHSNRNPGNLRRNVLLSNTMGQSNCTDTIEASDMCDENKKLNEYEEISSILSEQEESLNYSMEATIGSDDEAFDLLSITDLKVKDDTDCPDEKVINCKPVLCQVNSVTSKTTATQKQRSRKNEINHANSLPSQPIFYEDQESNITNKKITSLKPRKKSTESPSTNNKQSNRTPLGFLGGENSPDIKRLPKPYMQDDRSSRVPRYRGKLYSDSPVYGNQSPRPCLKAGKEN